MASSASAPGLPRRSFLKLLGLAPAAPLIAQAAAAPSLPHHFVALGLDGGAMFLEPFTASSVFVPADVLSHGTTPGVAIEGARHFSTLNLDRAQSLRPREIDTRPVRPAWPQAALVQWGLA